MEKRKASHYINCDLCFLISRLQEYFGRVIYNDSSIEWDYLTDLKYESDRESCSLYVTLYGLSLRIQY